ncbi:hypothetical protein FRC00_014088 [Tulasnella sp. 408]|nr:hypothetical protein FRC00_014088 [Tulasnella sp. 408]
MAYETSVKLGNSMHWSTYWAHLRKDGVYRRDLNAELCHPSTSSIAKSWGEVFEHDLFAECGRRTTQAIEQVIEEIRLLRITRAMLCFGAMLVAVHEALQNEQNEISRSLSPHVQQRLRDIYIITVEGLLQRANLERGRGSVGRQKDIVNRGVDHNRGVMFAGVSKILMSKLVDAAEKLKTFSASVQSYLNGMSKWVIRGTTGTRNHSYLLAAFSVSEIDRAQLRRRWASDYENSRTTRAAGQTTYSSHDVGFNLDRLLGEHKAIKMETQTPSREPTPANPDGVAAVLTEAALREMIQIVHEALQKEQKDISRSLSPHVQKRLRDVYICAMLERGRGSTARQRDIVNRGVQDRRGDRFVGVSKILLSELDAAAETVGNALDASLSELARKVELLMSVLWENINSTAEQLVIRNAAVEVMAEISQQIQFWIRAEEACRKQGVLV